jgi:hypothetical protein
VGLQITSLEGFQRKEMISKLFALIAAAFFLGGCVSALVIQMMRHLEWRKPILPSSTPDETRARLQQRIILCVWTVSSLLLFMGGYILMR